jgi:hypothetical protein
MKPFHTFVLINENAGADVTQAVLDEIAEAVNAALQGEFKDAWGYDYLCRAGTDLASVGPNEKAVRIQADSTVQGAAGFHDDGSIQVFRDGLPSLTSGAFALSVVISHEIFETAGDLAANRWADDGGGTEYALELCDAVEAYSYKGWNGVALSDFLLPAFFDPTGEAPYSHAQYAPAPFTTAPASGADYQIVRRVSESGAQQVTAIQGSIPESRKNAKIHPSSRTSRRLDAARSLASDLRPWARETPSTPETPSGKLSGMANPFARPRAPIPPLYPPGDPRAPAAAPVAKPTATYPATAPTAPAPAPLPPVTQAPEAKTPGALVGKLFVAFVEKQTAGRIVLTPLEKTILEDIAKGLGAALEAEAEALLAHANAALPAKP